MVSQSANRRDAGLNLLTRLNRWMIGGAIALAVALTGLAQRASHGHARASSAGGAAAPATPAPSSSDDGGASSLQGPAQVPAAAPAAPSASVVSGGS